ncbi:MAG: alkaline phosphatase, partial [Alphaproteobacteria bacterium]|nr:alkaline phosphatase [Alphaproteobacteria bacterium]
AEPKTFAKVGELAVAANDGSEAAEILAASADEQTLIYTDSPAGSLGFVDVSDASSPAATGVLRLDGEPTSVAVNGNYALVAVNTSESFVEPSGHLAVVDVNKRQVEHRCDVGGQPDSVAISPDGAYLAVAIENERDEDLNEGAMPQLPAGHLAVFDLDDQGMPTNCDAVRIVDLTGLADVAGDDPEPEYVSINDDNMVAVTLQENNYVVIADLASGAVVSHFSAGSVDLENVDLTDDGQVSMTESAADVPREPDAIAWLDNDRLATANEGDLVGGGRGFTVFDRSGAVIWDSGSQTEQHAAAAETYPDDRSPAKGTEPETVAFADYDGSGMMFVALERANSVLVYHVNGGDPTYVQLLPTGVGPEGILPLPGRNLVAVANEADPGEGLPSTIDLFATTD